MPEEDDEKAEVIRFPLPKAEPPKNPEPPCTCGSPPNIALCAKHGG